MDNKQYWKRNTVFLFTGQALSLIGSQLVNFAIVWWLTTTTGSATVLAGGSIAILLPAALLGPFAGTFIDRFDRRKIMAICDGLIMLGTLVWVVLFWTNTIQVWHIIAVLVISSCLGVVQWSGLQALMSTIVPTEHLQRIQGINTTLRSIITIGAPPLGALLMTLLPIHIVLSVDAITATIGISTLFMIRLPKHETPVESQKSKLTIQTILSDTKEGINYVFAWKGLRTLILAGMVIIFLVEPLFSLLPLLVTDFFKQDAIGLASIQAFWGTGSLIGGAILAAWGGFKKKVYTISLGIFLQGISILMIALAPGNWFFLALAGMFMIGLNDAFVNGPLFAFIQTKVPEQKQGRVFSLFISLTSLLAPLSLAIAGPVTDWVGIKFWYYVGGAAMMIMGLFIILYRPLRTVEDTASPE